MSWHSRLVRSEIIDSIFLQPELLFFHLSLGRHFSGTPPMVVRRWQKNPCGNLQCSAFGCLVGPAGRWKQLRDDTPGRGGEMGRESPWKAKLLPFGVVVVYDWGIYPKKHWIHLNSFRLVKYCGLAGLARYVQVSYDMQNMPNESGLWGCNASIVKFVDLVWLLRNIGTWWTRHLSVRLFLKVNFHFVCDPHRFVYTA